MKEDREIWKSRPNISGSLSPNTSDVLKAKLLTESGTMSGQAEVTNEPTDDSGLLSHGVTDSSIFAGEDDSLFGVGQYNETKSAETEAPQTYSNRKPEV